MSQNDAVIILATVMPMGGGEYRVARHCADTFDEVIFKEPYCMMSECQDCGVKHDPFRCPNNVDRKGMRAFFAESEVFTDLELARESISEAHTTNGRAELEILLSFDFVFPLGLVKA